MRWQRHGLSLQFLLQLVDERDLPLQALHLPGPQSESEYWHETDQNHGWSDPWFPLGFVTRGRCSRSERPFGHCYIASRRCSHGRCTRKETFQAKHLEVSRSPRPGELVAVTTENGGQYGVRAEAATDCCPCGAPSVWANWSFQGWGWAPKGPEATRKGAKGDPG